MKKKSITANINKFTGLPKKLVRMLTSRWLQLIANKTGLQFSPTDFSNFNNVTYQMIHRTASVCSLNKPRTVIVYQVFDVKRRLPNYKQKLTALANAIGASGKIDILLNIIKANRTKEYKTLDEQIAKM